MAAQVHADIMRAPMQYLTLVGDMGSTLSGGQRQRVLLALYRRPKILILDEGTANLDEQNESFSADLIDQMSITRIVVAHRPALLRRAKRVFTIGGRALVETRERPALERLKRSRLKRRRAKHRPTSWLHGQASEPEHRRLAATEAARLDAWASRMAAGATR
jgi:ABC-type bacteriocin/lantibiotic exporter with double-glycine peptidase domain